MKDSDNQLQKRWDTPAEKNLSFFKSLLVTGLWDNTDLIPPSHSNWSWTGHLCQNTVQCLKYFCNWLLATACWNGKLYVKMTFFAPCNCIWISEIMPPKKVPKLDFRGQRKLSTFYLGWIWMLHLQTTTYSNDTTDEFEGPFGETSMPCTLYRPACNEDRKSKPRFT